MHVLLTLPPLAALTLSECSVARVDEGEDWAVADGDGGVGVRGVTM